MNDAYTLILGANADEWRQKPPDGLDIASLAHMAATLLPPADEADISTREGYALARMKTLSRKPHIPCPDDERLRKALWLALGAVAFDPKTAPARARTRLDQAAQAAITLTSGDPELREHCGELAEAIARLLSASIRMIKGG